MVLDKVACRSYNKQADGEQCCKTPYLQNTKFTQSSVLHEIAHYIVFLTIFASSNLKDRVRGEFVGKVRRLPDPLFILGANIREKA
jgi:predicted SprT family Zn-dependent metalloprotease